MTFRCLISTRSAHIILVILFQSFCFFLAPGPRHFALKPVLKKTNFWVVNHVSFIRSPQKSLRNVCGTLPNVTTQKIALFRGTGTRNQNPTNFNCYFTMEKNTKILVCSFGKSYQMCDRKLENPNQSKHWCVQVIQTFGLLNFI